MREKRIVYIYSVLILVFCFWLGSVTENVNAEVVTKSKIYNLEDCIIEPFEVSGKGNGTYLGLSDVRSFEIDLSMVDFSFLEGMSSDRYTIALTGVLSSSDVFTKCELNGADNSTFSFVLGDFISDAYPLGDVFSIDIQLSSEVQSVVVDLKSSFVVFCKTDTGTVRVERSFSFSDLSVVLSWQENTNGEVDGGEGGEGGSNLPIVPDDLTVSETAIYNALSAYFEDNPLDVIVVQENSSFNKELNELTFSEVCLLGLFLISLGSSILHIIGGKAWNK